MRTTPTSQPLSSLDATFLALESRGVPFVFACILELDREIPVGALRDHVRHALVHLPRYRQRVERGRFGTARWLDDEEFRIEHHVDAIEAPRAERPLEELAQRMLGRELPPAHSPWRLWTVHGLPEGRGAVIALVHHSLVDGLAGIRLLQQVLSPDAPPEPGPRPRERRSLRRLVAWPNVVALARLLRDGLRASSQLGTNPRRVGATRVVASHTVRLDDVRAIERAFGVTNNDVVLATVAGALHLWAVARGRDPAELDNVRVMVPVGRHGKDGAVSGNRVVLLLAPLPVDLADARARLARVAERTGRLKRGHMADAGELMVALSDATTPSLLASVFRLALRRRAFNAIVTNVPGPRTPLALLGARITRLVPIVNLWPHVGLGIAVASYADMLTFGLQGDRAVLPDLDALRAHLAASFDELRALAGGRPERLRAEQPDRADA